MSIDYERVAVVCDGAGAATVYSEKPLDGILSRIRLNIGTLAAGAVDFTITDKQTDASLLAVTNLAASTDYSPRGAAVTPANVAITNSFVGIPVTGGIKIVVAGGGAAGAGSVDIWVER